MREAVDLIEAAIPTTEPAEIYSVTHKALASSLKVIARADDSSGIIGDACRRLLELHPQAAAAAGAPVAKLIDWMMKFQFDDDEVDYFELDPVAYAPALGEVGMAAYRKRLAEVEAKLGPRPSEGERWTSPHSHEWFTLDWNAQRLAVLDHDIDAIIRTHAKDRKVAAWLEDTAEAFEETGKINLASDWAKQATDFDRGRQSLKAADYWCRLLEEHRPGRGAGRPALGVPQVALVDLSGPAAQGRRQGVARLPGRGGRDAGRQPERRGPLRTPDFEGTRIRVEPCALARPRE